MTPIFVTSRPHRTKSRDTCLLFLSKRSFCKISEKSITPERGDTLLARVVVPKYFFFICFLEPSNTFFFRRMRQFIDSESEPSNGSSGRGNRETGARAERPPEEEVEETRANCRKSDGAREPRLASSAARRSPMKGEGWRAGDARRPLSL